MTLDDLQVKLHQSGTRRCRGGPDIDHSNLATAPRPRKPVLIIRTEVDRNERFEGVCDIVALNVRRNPNLFPVERDLACPE